MDLDKLTIGEAKQLASLLGQSAVNQPHPLNGKKVLAVIQHGFIFFGKLRQDGQYLFLDNASNVRYWQTRKNGLQDFVEKGAEKDDKIDKCASSPCVNEHLFIQEITKW